jgi:hypothetical protein
MLCSTFAANIATPGWRSSNMWRAASIVSGVLATTPSRYQNSPRRGAPLASHGPVSDAHDASPIQ